LSATPDTAHRVGRRRYGQPALLIIRTREACANGVVFYCPTPDTYLVRHVPPAYITLASET